MTRSVIVVSTAANRAKKITTSATTWGQLKAEPGVAEFVQGNVEAVVNPGNVTLGRDDSHLPEGDFKLYLVPTKNKAGQISLGEANEIGYKIAEAIYKASALAEQERVISLKDELIQTVEDFFNVSLDEDSNCPECIDALEEAAKYE